MSKRGQNEGSIRQRKDGTWEARHTVGVKENGKPNRKSVYAKTRKEVKDKFKFSSIFNSLSISKL